MIYLKPIHWLQDGLKRLSSMLDSEDYLRELDQRTHRLGPRDKVTRECLCHE